MARIRSCSSRVESIISFISFNMSMTPHRQTQYEQALCFCSRKARIARAFRLSINHGVVKGRLPIKLIPALTACTSKRMKAQRFSYFAGFAARERMREAKPEKLEKVANSRFFGTLKARIARTLALCASSAAVKSAYPCFCKL